MIMLKKNFLGIEFVFEMRVNYLEIVIERGMILF